MALSPADRAARLRTEGHDMLRHLDPQAFEIAKLLSVSNFAALKGFRVTSITLEVIKLMFIWTIYQQLIETYQEIAEDNRRWRIPDWIRKLKLRLVMTFHPTPSQLYGMRELDVAVYMAMINGDFALLRRAFKVVYEQKELRNTERPGREMLMNFLATFGETIGSVARRLTRIDLKALSWILVDFDGNPDQTWQDALHIAEKSKSGKQFRFGASEVEQLGEVVLGRGYTRADIKWALSQGANLELAELKDYRLAQLIANLEDQHNVDAFVIADCETVEHVLLMAAFISSVGRNYRVCPLLERFDRIEAWVETFKELLTIPEYVEYCNDKQMVQVGPSDSAAHGGFWALMGIGHLIRLIVMTIRDCGLEPVLFIGAGRNPARGGGRWLYHLATLVPRLEGLVREVHFTVQGGMVAENFRNETIGEYVTRGLLKALHKKAKHDEQISEALYKFSKLAAEAHQPFNREVRRLLARSPWLEVLSDALFSNRPLNKGTDPAGAGMRAIAVQQLCTLIGGEALLFLGWREAFEQMSDAEKALLMKSSRFKQGLRYALEATHLTDYEALQSAARACGLGDHWFETIQDRIRGMQRDFTELLGEEAKGIAQDADTVRKELQIRRWLSTEGILNLEVGVQVLLLQYILAKLGRLG